MIYNVILRTSLCIAFHFYCQISTSLHYAFNTSLSDRQYLDFIQEINCYFTQREMRQNFNYVELCFLSYKISNV